MDITLCSKHIVQYPFIFVNVFEMYKLWYVLMIAPHDLKTIPLIVGGKVL